MHHRFRAFLIQTNTTHSGNVFGVVQAKIVSVQTEFIGNTKESEVGLLAFCLNLLLAVLSIIVDSSEVTDTGLLCLSSSYSSINECLHCSSSTKSGDP
ncbi:hypothetical protein D3C81_2149730 [compost metagenome]